MLKIIAVWFEEDRFATIVGLSMLVGNLGSVLAGAPLSLLAQAAGWRGVFVAIALVSILVGALCWLLVRDRSAENADAALPKLRFDRTVILGNLLAVLRNRDTWPAVVVNFGGAGAFFAFAGLWATPFLTQAYGMTRNTAAKHLSLYFLSFALGCVLIGGLSDRIGKRKPVLIVGLHIFAASWLLWLSDLMLPVVASYALFFVMGISTASVTLSWACAKEVNPPQLSGMSTSVTNMGGFLATALLQPLVGWILDLGWQGTLSETGARIYSAQEYRSGLLAIAVAAWIAALGSWFIRETGCRNIWQSQGAANRR